MLTHLATRANRRQPAALRSRPTIITHPRRYAASQRHVRTLILTIGTVVSSLACRKNEAPGADATSPASSPVAAPSVAPSPAPVAKASPFDAATTRAYSAPKLARITCPYVAPTPPDPAAKTSGCASCKADEHCKTFSSHGRTFGACVRSACTKDTDCPAGDLCVCGPPNACWPSNCRDANDCGGRDCALGMFGNSHVQSSYCRTANDTCSEDAHCGPDGECVYLEKAWGCRKLLPIPPG